MIKLQGPTPELATSSPDFSTTPTGTFKPRQIYKHQPAIHGCSSVAPGLQYVTLTTRLLRSLALVKAFVYNSEKRVYLKIYKKFSINPESCWDSIK
ncbi:hypothetical protein TNCV_1183321 [Trichonephila clavipes]|nr:hypothetical protein TNCV_1183321 [Trichonephila clavipes]